MKNKILLSYNICVFLLFSIIMNGQEWTYINMDNSELPSNFVRSFDIGSDQDLWIGTQNGGLANFDGLKWEVYNTSNSEIPSNNITNIAIGPQKEIWITAYVDGFGNQLAKLKDRTWQSWRQLENGFPLFAESLNLDKTGNLWISHPFYVVKFDGVNFTSFNHTNTCLPTLGNPFLTSQVYSISENQRWVGIANNSGAGGGIVYMDNDECEFYTPYNSSFPETGQFVYRIFQSPMDSNIIWIGSRSVISSFNRATNQWINLSPTGSSSTDMAIDKTGKIWTFILANGIAYYEADKWIKLNAQPATSNPGQIHISSDNRLWVATENNGLAYLDLDAFQTTSIEHLTKADNFSIFPTISSGQFSYSWTPATSVSKPLVLSITNIHGKIIYQEKIESGLNEISIFKKSKTSGLYFYTLYTDLGQILKKGKLMLIK